MLTQHTLTQLKILKLDGMAHAFDEQLALPAAASLAFEERFGMLVDREITHRAGKRLTRLLKDAKLKVAASIQGDAIRISGAKKDDLQAAIQLVRTSITDLPLQFTNFRD